MRGAIARLVVVAIVGIFLSDEGQACGDKLVVLGRGVRFERLQMAQHPGAVLLFMNPDSSLPKADQEFQFSAALELAGHTVELVASRAELQRILSAGKIDVILADLADAVALRGEVGNAAGAPEILPVLYKPSAADLAKAKEMTSCLGQAAKRKGRKLLETVDEMMALRESGRSSACTPPAKES